MKYALFVLGLLLMLCGAYAVYHGAGIVDTERGWSDVIAGTTAVVGGVLTLGLTWVIKNLEQLRATLAATATSAVKSAVPPASHHDSAVDRTTEAPGRATSWPPHTSPAYAAGADEAFAAPPSGSGEAHPDFHPEPHDETLADAFTGERADKGEERDRPAGERRKASASLPSFWRRGNDEAREREPARPSLLKKAKTARAAAPAKTEPPAPADIWPSSEAPSQHDRDWFDSAFADLDSAMAQLPHAPHEAGEPADAHGAAEVSGPVADAHVQDARAAAPHLAPAAMAEGEDEAALAPPVVPAESQAEEPPAAEPEGEEEPAIISRYEVEGTCYIMFADGSIEAQSERGIARFQSMADLKAYFETQPAP